MNTKIFNKKSLPPYFSGKLFLVLWICNMEARGVEALSEDIITQAYGCGHSFDVTERRSVLSLHLPEAASFHRIARQFLQ
jgi:hypothetical protein